eukprot:GHRQ01009157.1.p2 GENE.GHRQ01009157.1~~GHRQ01009157.1.p2  ORF type:complete len:184 (+),score=38.68 GHRQ01009157.1:179-730(+)
MPARYLTLPRLAFLCSLLIATAAVRPDLPGLSLQQQHRDNRAGIAWPITMEPAKVAQTAELIGVERNVGTWSIGHATKDFLAGAASGMVGIAAGQPLDTLRVRLQQRGCQQQSVSGVWKDMARAEGVRGLFRGMSYPVYTTALQNAVTFQAQGVASRLLTGSADKAAVSWQVSCLAGMFAGQF